MRSTQAISITLPHEMLEMIRGKVASGEYASESEVIRDGLRTLKARDSAVEKWLHDEVTKSYDEYKADLSTGISAAKVSAALDTKLKAALKKKRQE